MYYDSHIKLLSPASWILTLFLYSIQVSAQSDTIGQLDPKGKKLGYHYLYVDSTIVECDSASAFYKVFGYYRKGQNLFDFYQEKWKTRDSLSFMGVESERGKPVPLSGKITWYDRRNQMITYEQGFENGHPVKFREIRYKKKKGRGFTWAFIRTHEFTKRYHNIPGTFLILEQNNQAIYNMDEWARFWFREGKRGWKKYRIREVKKI